MIGLLKAHAHDRNVPEGTRGPMIKHMQDQSHHKMNPRAEIHGLVSKGDLKDDMSSN